ncbi:cyanoexosortase B [Gloeothece verrucosa]|uniref:Eight transmembrane protein EpsH n=1 Tax=Gloeothece verrucosa (strain PCC 7822) TaxID=497965 RepID=E0UI70_GLOV7|nr:cyanoexosortase B [Gloeothece verrucosa]ADN15722.1 eight transmembrane protein EpsH [Gloeothece verrucosa PCC 7822]
MNIGETNLTFKKNLLPLSIVALMVLLYGPIIWHWYDGWANKSINIEHEYFSHGLIGLPYAVSIVWIERHQWQKLKNNHHPLGGILLGLAAAFYLTGNPTWVNLSFPVMLTGICLWLKGIPGLKLLWFPLLLVLLATPNPAPYLITPYTLPLQQFIAGVAGFILMQFGFNVSVDGIYLAVDGKSVEVAPYCAGLKMLFTSLYVSLLLVHWTGTLKNVKKVIFMLIGAGGISIIANIIRNSLLSIFHGTGQEDKFIFLHEGSGGDIYSVIMLMMIIVLFHISPNFEAKPKLEFESKTDKINE